MPGGGLASERPVDTLRVGLGRDPRSIDPRHVGDEEGELVVRALFDGLVDIGPDGAVRPASATWEVDDDGLTYRFRIREDRFHDGSPVTAQHHAAAILAVLDAEQEPLFREDLVGRLRGAALEVLPDDGEVQDPAAESRPWGTPEDVLDAGGIEVVGERELVLRLERPDPLFLYRLADPVLVPLPSIAFEDPDAFALEPVGNGPFQMAGPREPGAFVRLRANVDHPSAPRIDELVLQIYADDPDRSQRWADLVAGRLQIAAIPATRREEARERFGAPFDGRSGAGLHDQPLLLSYAYGFAMDIPPFDDRDLRRAISATIDREVLARDLAAAGVEPATALLPPVAGGTAAECPHCRRDPELAAELIAAWRARIPEGTAEPRVVLNYPRGGGHATVAERIAADVERDLALEVRLQARDFGSLVRSVVAGDAPLFRYGLMSPVGGRAAAAGMLEAAVRSDAPGNWIRWADPATDELLDTWTITTAASTVRSIEAELLDAAVLIPLLWTRQDLVVLPEVVGFRSDGTGRWWPELVRLR